MSCALNLKHQRELVELRNVRGAIRALSIGSGVFRMRTAHCMRVDGGCSVGTRGSGSLCSGEEMVRWERSGGGGGGSANSISRFSFFHVIGKQHTLTFGHRPKLYQAPISASRWGLDVYVFCAIIFPDLGGVRTSLEASLAVAGFEVKVVPAECSIFRRCFMVRKS